MDEQLSRTIQYGVNDIPPPLRLLMLSLQHLMLMSVSISLPILMAAQISASGEPASNLIMFSMIVCGIASILQSSNLPFFGAKYLCPNICLPSFFSLTVSAALAGGMPLVRGMLIFSGLVEMALAPLLHKLKKIFPAYIVGFIIAMVGISFIRISVISFFGLELRGDIVRNNDLIIGAVTLLTIWLCNIWGNGNVRIFCLLIGVTAGWSLAVMMNPECRHALTTLARFPVFALPSISGEFLKLHFRIDRMLPFFVISVSGAVKSFGNLLTVQKISQPELEEIDYGPIRKGIVTNGFAKVLAGILGGMATGISSGNIGLAGNTKVLSRWIGIGAGTILILLSFSPVITEAMMMIPKPVLGSSMIYSGCYLICTGMEELFSESWDERKTFVIGISFVFGLSTALLPEVFARTPEMVQAVFTDPLPTATICVIILNLLVNLDLTVLSWLRQSPESIPASKGK